MLISFKPLWMKAVNEIFVTRLSGICETWSNLMPLRLILGARKYTLFSFTWFQYFIEI